MKELTIEEFLEQSIDLTTKSMVKVLKKTKNKETNDVFLLNNLLKKLIFVRHNLDRDLLEL